MGSPERTDWNNKSNITSRVRHAKALILQFWESRVRLAIPAAEGRTQLVLRDTLPDLLDNLERNLISDSSSADFKGAGTIGFHHGIQRAGLKEYSLAQVLSEYRILRQIVFEVLEAEGLMDSVVRDTVLNVIDEGVHSAAAEFTNERHQALEQSNRDLEHFAVIAAHDLRAPLSMITGFVDVLTETLKDKISADELNYLQTIERSSLHMMRLIDRLLDYSRINSKRAAFEVVNTSKVMQNLKQMLHDIIKSAGAELICGELPLLYGEPSLLSELFQNLISNAIKFRDSSRHLKITISAHEEKHEWHFSVKDNGVGISKEELENVFTLFKKIHERKEQQGSGIGLATVRKIVGLHGGRIWIESEPGVGSIFHFTIAKELSSTT